MLKFGKLKRLTAGDYIIPIILILFAVIIIIPIWYVVTISLTPQHVFFQTRLLLYPAELTFEHYYRILNLQMMRTGFRNTLFVTIVGTAYVMFLNVTFAYAMLKPIPGRKFVWIFLMTTMFVSGGMVPWFMLIVNLGLPNNLLVMILPHGLAIITVVLMQSYMRTLSPEFEESAKLDGAGDIRLLWSIVLPLCKPMLATLSLFAAVGGWNRWFESMMFMQRSDGWSMPHVLRNLLANANLAMEGLPIEARLGTFGIGLQSAAVVITMIPIVCVYPFLQKYFVKGITLGGVKG